MSRQVDELAARQAREDGGLRGRLADERRRAESARRGAGPPPRLRAAAPASEAGPCARRRSRGCPPGGSPGRPGPDAVERRHPQEDLERGRGLDAALLDQGAARGVAERGNGTSRRTPWGRKTTRSVGSEGRCWRWAPPGRHGAGAAGPRRWPPPRSSLPGRGRRARREGPHQARQRALRPPRSEIDLAKGDLTDRLDHPDVERGVELDCPPRKRPGSRMPSGS